VRGLAFDSGPSAWQGSRPVRPTSQFPRRSALANPELGAKQICPACAAKFYDLGRRPAVCPKCATQFDPEEALRNRRVRARSTPADYEAEEEAPVAKVVEPDGFEDEVDETPEVDVAAAEPIVAEEDAEDVEGAPAAPADELGVDFVEEEEELEEETAEVPFLVDEDEDDDFEDEIEGLPDDEPD
jgi:uncharacterized protein (TIGR02300 family)